MKWNLKLNKCPGCNNILDINSDGLIRCNCGFFFNAMKEQQPNNYEELEKQGLGHWNEDGEWVRDFIVTKDGITPPIKEEE